MDRALDDIVFDETVGQDGMFVRAEVADGMNGTVDEVDADELAADLDGQGFVLP
jgi:hypothetical protein